MDGYDINQIFAEIELEVIRSLKRNIGNHYKDEFLEGFKWPAWQTMKLKDLQRFRKENEALLGYYAPKLDASIEKLITDQFSEGAKKVSAQALKAGVVGSDPMAFFNMPDRKVRALIDEAKSAVNISKTSALRFANDQYRQIVFKSQMYASTGAGTLYKAVDMASKDFLDKGINSIEYSDGRRVNIASYSEMAIRTANKKASLKGEGEMRQQLGLDLVIVSQYGACSPTCLPWQGRVYVDDVFSNGNPDDYAGKYPRLSLAIEGGLLHPNCRHRTSTYFEGITEDVEKIDEAQALANYNAEQKQRYNERMIRKYKRLSEGSLDDKNVEMYYGRQKAWERVQRDHIDANPELRRNPWRESFRTSKVKEPIVIDQDIQSSKQLITPLNEFEKKKNLAFQVTKINSTHLVGIEHVTDEVYLTSERVHRHIAKHHPEMMTRKFSDIVETIKNPDYVYKGKLDRNELIFLKKSGAHILIAPVRLITPEEFAVNKTHRNTLLTFYQMRVKRASKSFGIDFLNLMK